MRRIEGPGGESNSGQIGITPEYYLLLLLSGEGNLGRGRWELKKAALTLRGELL